MSPRSGGFHGEFLWELEIVERQLAALAGAIPEEQYDWRPDATARSAREATSCCWMRLARLRPATFMAR